MMFLLATAGQGHAQFDPKKVCTVSDGRLVFTLDQRWSAAQKKEVSRMFSLDSTMLAKAFALTPEIRDSVSVWRTRKLDANRIELTLDPGKPAGKEEAKGKIFLLDDDWIKLAGEAESERTSVPYGVNRLTQNTIRQLSGNRIRFFLPGHRNARKIFLSGSFNAWSTIQTPMQTTDSGWTATLNLKPGKYSYKFVIDGKWTNDSFNKLREDDRNGGYNNIFFCYNYRFELNGSPNAKNVLLTGSFNGWDAKTLRMIPFRGSWLISMYLREGTHAYKFIVDGSWITDPANKVTRPDGRGNLNSFLGIGDTLFFTLTGYPGAKKVVVSGNFNGWNGEELVMAKSRSGWTLPYVLSAGNYEYKFVVDGQWITDPGNPYTTGSGDHANSFLAVKPNHTFRLEQHSGAKNVSLSGSFNGWSKEGYRMVEQDGDWLFPLYLNPGKYVYKFVVDKKWIIDPTNSLWEENEFGTGNSVLWIEPEIP
jgi:1,4-alpha-glucan branching enzyme